MEDSSKSELPRALKCPLQKSCILHSDALDFCKTSINKSLFLPVETINDVLLGVTQAALSFYLKNFPGRIRLTACVLVNLAIGIQEKGEAYTSVSSSVLSLSLETSLFSSEKVNHCLSSRWFSSTKRRDSASPWLIDETEASLSVDRRRIEDSLSLGGSSMIRRQTSLSLGGCPRSLNLSLSVGLLDGEGPLSPCGSSRIERFDSVPRWLSSTAAELSADGSPRRRWGSLSFALRDSFRSTS
ncbi:hypothetical protein F2Q70_00025198 [Brassica cretica]|uniref:Uncharacterized protein n=1 Tax=Brassica cretica TaxID=69181 RepID=A0A8S9LF57_BRACR|nr:hypothetical protein F2Q70_00025198 [Brassica cretica]